jgi:acylaminoacyl-peptidase
VVSPTAKSIAYLGYDDRYQGYQITRLYVMGIDGGNPRVVSADFDRDPGAPAWASNDGAACTSFDDRGVRKLGPSLERQGAHAGGGLGGTDLGPAVHLGRLQRGAHRPLGLRCTTRRSEPADVGTAYRQEWSPRADRANDDLPRAVEDPGRGARADLEVRRRNQREIQGWVITPPDLRSGEEVPLDPRDHGGPFAAVRA